MEKQNTKKNTTKKNITKKNSNEVINRLTTINPIEIDNTKQTTISNIINFTNEITTEECGQGKRCAKIGNTRRRCDTKTPRNPKGTNTCYEIVKLTIKKGDLSLFLEVIPTRNKTYNMNLLNTKILRIKELKKMSAVKLTEFKNDLRSKLAINAKDKEGFYYGDLKDEIIIQIISLEHNINKKNNVEEKVEEEKEEKVEEEKVEEEKVEEEIVEEEIVEEEPEYVRKNNIDLIDNIPIPDLNIENINENLLMEPNIESIEYNNYLFKRELLENNNINNNNEYLYPTLNDPEFNIKISKKKEFSDTKYIGDIDDIEKKAEEICKLDFELMPHQLFVKNFLSFNTPYNCLLLYHGLGTGKTCSAIGIAEEMRNYMKQVNLQQKILIIASPNVQNNFKLQLFDERKLKNENGVWNLNTCIGDSLINEINPTSLHNITREKVISQIKSLIKQYYSFKGYSEFANYIKKKISIDDNSGLNIEEKKKIEIKKIKELFNNRLIIIDEVHNIRPIQDNNEHKRLSVLLPRICKYAENIRMVLLSATPMYNNYNEIIWLVNLMNMIDKRSKISEDMVFDKKGNLLPERIDKQGVTIESGYDLLKRKLTGYVSYIRGENPYTFPYRIYPKDFTEENLLDYNNYYTKQMNDKVISEPIKHIPLYINKIENYQKQVYNYIISNLLYQNPREVMVKGKVRKMPNFENMESFGYTYLSDPIQALNIVYPNQEFDKIILNEKKNSNIISQMIGKVGLTNIINYETENTNTFQLKYNYDYKQEVVENYGKIFQLDKLKQYSSKMHKICSNVMNSEGIIMIYSQYIDGGIIPMALALEELGFTRYSSDSHIKPLFKKRNPSIPPIDSITMKEKTNTVNFNQAKYVMITGDQSISSNNIEDIKFATSTDNANGEKVKVILISKAGSEGIDFKNVRQIHLLDPWYNMNRIEQTIGRAVRNLSHCGLPFNKRNVEIYLHASNLDSDIEPADLYIYRYAEEKSIKIGKISRILKEVAVDCILNIAQTNFTVENLLTNDMNKKINLELSNGTIIKYNIGDKPYSHICDYMDNCNFSCNPYMEIKESDIIKNTYNAEYAKMNYSVILKRIRNIFKEFTFFTRDDIINLIQINNKYPIEHIDFVLTRIIDNKNQGIVDKYNRKGYIINKDHYYVFQPIEISDEKITIFERSKPINYKHEYIDIELNAPQEKSVVDKVIDKNTDKLTNQYHEIITTLLIEKENYNTEKKVAYTIIKLKEEIQQRKDSQSQQKDSQSQQTNNQPLIKDSKLKQNKVSITSSINQLTKYNLDTGEENWYKHLGRSHYLLIDNHKLTENQIINYLINHYIDFLDIEQKLIILTYLFENTDQALSDEEDIVKKYLNEKIIKNLSGNLTIILGSKKTIEIYIQNNITKKWNIAEKTDNDELMEKYKEKYKYEKDQINKYVGYISYDMKNKDIVFKYKNMDIKSLGALCSTSGKLEIRDRLNETLKNLKDDYSYTVEYVSKQLRYNLCVILEIIFRHSVSDSYRESGNKHSFFNLESAIINNIIIL